MSVYEVEYTDTFGGEANYCWVNRATVEMPDLTYYGYTGSADGSYTKANKVFRRELMKKAKAAMGLTGVRGATLYEGEMIQFNPYNMATVMFVTYKDCEEM